MQSQPADQKARIRLLQLGALLLLIAFMTMRPAFSRDGSDTVECLGVALVLLCVAGRMWSILYIGAKKNRELITVGPYSMTRNPLYFFSMLGAAGIGLFVGSLVSALILALLVYLVLVTTAGKEAAHLETLFGERYREYARRTPMFWPKPSLFREADDVAFSPAALKRTFLDGLLFIAALPAIELVEVVKETDFVPIFFALF
ncbi:isoprenylcysteine carboxylmethyltransferase family protein [Mesorhizobium sp. YC-39]|uniref:methyltransferase family protein n=1 Tax=unclassified Mesorhizobium TaxID=325217 RepID=UPI0021E7CBA9|nr:MULTISPECIES: isoprenylcysteine carboxylmethyltransferase family protein [unclassified Mesorhizobium]MCV3210463.1 isoprenylcysteine carboxylmethyltransferase family protein [Mesorhizobium sp. YC-2]MCV3232639.1 isoprenylcysteine carboxylmethyltransferase family protein [Mesorhizobium sp. YC-39]